MKTTISIIISMTLSLSLLSGIGQHRSSPSTSASS